MGTNAQGSPTSQLMANDRESMCVGQSVDLATQPTTLEILVVLDGTGLKSGVNWV